jgi:hypothetical protein
VTAGGASAHACTPEGSWICGTDTPLGTAGIRTQPGRMPLPVIGVARSASVAGQLAGAPSAPSASRTVHGFDRDSGAPAVPVYGRAAAVWV